MGDGQVGPWLGRITAIDGGLLVPGGGRPDGGDLALLADHVEVRRGEHRLALAWDHREDFQPSPDRPDELFPDGWCLPPWGVGRGGAIGACVLVRGSYVEPARPLLRADGLRARVARQFEGGVRLALWPSWRLTRAVEADRQVIGALCQLLAQQPELRARLGDPDRVGALVAELTARGLPPLPGRPTKMVDVEVTSALAALGYEHRLRGRPLPGATLPPLGTVRDAVLDHLRRNDRVILSDAQARGVDPAVVAEVVAARYTAIAPWPFGPLLGAATSP